MYLLLTPVPGATTNYYILTTRCQSIDTFSHSKMNGAEGSLGTLTPSPHNKLLSLNKHQPGYSNNI